MTISDIAKLAGISVAVVSRVLNDEGYVRGETRQKVENLIQKNDYRPNIVARSLICSNTSMIAVIMSNRLNPFFVNVLNAVESRTEQQRYSILFCNTSEDRNKECKAIAQATEHRVMGILFLPVLDPDERMEELLAGAEDSGILVVLINRDLHNSDLDIALIDNERVVYEGVRLLIELSHREIGIVTYPEVVKKGKARLDGYIQYLKDYGMEMEDEYICPGDSDEKNGCQVCENLLGLPDPPTAMLVTCDSATLDCIRYLDEYSLQMGRGVGLVGFDDISLLGTLGYEITVADRSMKGMGEIAYDLLTGRVTSPDTKRRRREILLQTRLIIHDSEKLQDVQAISQEEYL